MMDVLKSEIPTLVTLLLAAAVVTTAAPAMAEQEPELNSELSQFWSADRKVPVVQDKLFTREGRFGLGLYTGLMSSEPFLYYIPVGLRASYFFSDQLGLEVSGQFTDAPGVLSNDTELTQFVRNRRGEGFDLSTDTEDRFLWRANAVVTWSPLYGKFALLQRKLAHFDLNLVAGLGAVSVERPAEDRRSASNAIAPELVLGVGAQFFMFENFTLRLEGRGYVYQGAKTPVNKDSFLDQVKVPIEFQVGVSYLF